MEIDAQRLYPVFFYDAVRLAQDLAASAEHGEPFLGETGMIVVPEVTTENMRNAVNSLYTQGFFDHLIPVGRDQLRGADPFAWPP